MWHSVEYVCLSRIKLVLRVIKEILHAFQWAVLHTEVDSKWASSQKATGGQRLCAACFCVVFDWNGPCHLFALCGQPLWWWCRFPRVFPRWIMWGLKWSSLSYGFFFRYIKTTVTESLVGGMPLFSLYLILAIKWYMGWGCSGEMAQHARVCRHVRTCVCTVSCPGKVGLVCMPVTPVLGMWTGRQIGTWL